MCCAIGLAGAFVWVLLAGSNAGATSSISSNGSGASSSLVSPTIGGSGASTDGISTSPLGSLVVPGVDELAGGELARDQHQARLMNPEAVGLREVSRTKFENLSARQAVKLAGEAFPAVIDHPVGGPPQLPSGERIVGYVANNAAAVALPEGKHGVVESLQPIAVPSGHGHFAPIDLGLRQSGDGYTPTTSDVGVQIPTQLSEGIGMPADGVSLTPVSASGQPLAGSQGAVDGASVLYANTQTDTDTIAKPTTGGFEIDSLLRSVDSPTTLYFRVGMPAGAKLVNDTGPGGARVVLDGETIAAIAAISAQDAEGTSVPVKMRATDGTLAVDVATGFGEYDYPIDVDPRAYDETLGLPGPSESTTETNLESDSETDWRFHYEGGSFREYMGTGPVMEALGSVSNQEHDEFRYGAHGQASVGFLEEESSAGVSEQSGAITKIEFASHANSKENQLTLAGAGQSYSKVKEGFGDLWNESEKGYRGYNNENLVRIMQTANNSASEGYGFWLDLYNAWVGIYQEKGPEVSFNTSEAIIGESGRQNVLYGSGGGWLGEANGAVEIIAKDPGLGVSDLRIKDLTAGAHGEHWEFNDPVYEEHKCTGVWCNPTFKTNGANGMYFTYNKEMAEGANTFELCAEDKALTNACTDATVNVDNTRPSKIKLNGIAAEGAELNATQHPVTVEATDERSGIKSIALAVDGREVGSPAGSCSPGECTATGAWTIDGESIGAGEHKLVATATDFAGNQKTFEMTFAIRNATAMSIGPGTVDPVTGQFALNASDADIAGAGGVSRTYDSRNPTVGAEGPLGSPWSLNAGSGESLRLLPNGNAELTGTGGEPTTFAYKEGKFAAPKGDGNLTLEAKERESGKGVTEYLLKDPAAGTTIAFTQPINIQYTNPTYLGEFSANELYYNYEQVSNAVNAKGEVWVVYGNHNKVDRFNERGELTASFGTEGKGNGQFNKPDGIAIDTKGDLWITDSGNHRVEEFNEKGEYLKQFATGEGHGITVDGGQHIWVTTNERVYEFNEKGETLSQFGTQGTVAGDLEGAWQIAKSTNGDLWVTEGCLCGNLPRSRVQVFNEKGEYQFGFNSHEGGGLEPLGIIGIALDSHNDAWVTSSYQDDVEEYNEKGELVAKLGSEGESGGEFRSPEGIAVTANGTVFVTNSYTGRVEEWNHSTWLPTRREGTAPGDTRATSYRAVMVEGRPLTEPVEELGSVPTGVSCGKNPAEGTQAELSARLAELKTGCRALSFTYAEKTTATGENKSQWGEYNGRLMKVSVTAYNPAKSIEKMETKVVAEYAYDKQGRLRAEWDPRISPALKTIYGYDAEGHVAALTPPGQESWLLHYGTITSDPGTGRLLSVIHPSASTEAWQGEAVENTSPPTLSTSEAIVGKQMSAATNGSWSSNTLSYNYYYQWEDCSVAGTECTVIGGAVNQYYTPAPTDEGHRLIVQVIATNAGGSVIASSVPSAVVQTMSYSLKFGSKGEKTGEFRRPRGVVVDSKGDVWVADEENNRVQEFSSTGAYLKEVGTAGSGNGQLDNPLSLALDSKGDIYVADSGNNRIEEFNEKGEYVRQFNKYGLLEGVSLSSPQGITLDSEGHVWVTDGSSKIIEFTAEGKYLSQFGLITGEPGYPGFFKNPEGIASEGKTLWIADTGNNQLQHCTPSEKGTSCAIVGSKGSGNGQFASPTSIALDAHNNLWITDYGNNRVEELSSEPEHRYLQQFGGKGSGNEQFEGPSGIGLDSTGDVYVSDVGNSRVVKWVVPSSESKLPPPPSVGTNSVSTIEYRVPMFGSSAPHQMTSAELAKWGQTKDEPMEATAIFPPDEPQGWPAGDYKRATVLYMDGQARTTNTASPSESSNGAISTVEYNSLNEVTRKLTAADRAIALKEGSKSVEAAEALSTRNIYNGETQAEKEQEEKEGKHEPGVRLLETLGPEHKIKLANGTEEETRDHQKLSYNEESPSGETHETYDLVTKKKEWVETAAKEELDEHVTTTSYNGQGKLGWTLRAPTEIVTEALNGHKATQTTSYEPITGQAKETASAVSLNAPVYASQFGSTGSGGGQFKGPVADAFDASGDLWVTDHNNSRVEEFSAAGVFIKAFGWGVGNGKAEFEVCTSVCQAGISGSGNGQFTKPEGIAVNQATGNVYVVDSGNNRVEEFEGSTGKFVRIIGASGSGEGQLSNPLGIAITPTGGEVWVGDAFNNRVDRFSETGTPKGSFGKAGTGNGEFSDPDGIAFSDGNAYVVDIGNNRVQVFSMSGKYIAQFGSKGTGNGQFESPYGVTADPVSGDLYVGDYGNGRIEEFTPGGIFLDAFGKKGSGNGELLNPEKVAINRAGDIYVADVGNNRIEQWEPVPSAPVYTSQFGNTGSESEKLDGPAGDAFDAHGDLWVTNIWNHRVEELSSAGVFMHSYGSAGTGDMDFEAPVGIAINQASGDIYVGDSKNNRVQELNEKGEFVAAFGFGVSNGKSEFEICTSSCKAGIAGSGAGQFKSAEGIAIDSKGDIWVTDNGNNRVDEFSSTDAFIKAFGFGVSNGESKFETCTTTCQAGLVGSGNGEFNEVTDLAFSDGNLYVTDYGNNRVQEFSEKAEYLAQFGSKGSGNGQFNGMAGIGVDANGNLYVADGGNDRVQEFTPSGSFLAAFGLKGAGNGQFSGPEKVVVSSSGALYVTDGGNNRVEEWTPAPRPGNEGANDTKTTEYTAAANTEYPSCGGHPEWANLACQVEPAAQPGDSGPPALPVTTTTYNMWDEPETVTEKIGAVIRTTKKKYDAAGREIENEESSTSSEDAALPAVTDEYNSETGALVKLSETLEGKAKTITSVYNTLGQLASYTDAEGSTTKYAYDIDGRVEEVSEPKGSQIYAYDPTTGFLTKLLDSAAKTFTATYGVAGEMLTEGYPNGMTAKYTYNSIGQKTNLEYEKTTDCIEEAKEKCKWFKDADAFGPEGELATQTSTLSKETYGYSEAGQLAQTKEESPTGASCIEERTYGYNESTGERLSLETRKPNSKGECIEGGVVEGHAYDVVGRLLDPGVTYDALGNMTKIPALDAGGQAITSSFYVDNQVDTQEQNEKTIDYTYDPAGRTMLAKSKIKTGPAMKTISHYAGPREALTWTCEEEEGKKECEEAKETKWTRNIPGIDGALDAIQTNGGTPVLQLHDLQGNIVGTVGTSETAEPLLSYSGTEFGVHKENKAPKFSWLGAKGAESELETGVITAAGATYVPQLAGTLQIESPIPPGAAPNGAMVTEAYSPPELPWANGSGNEGAANTVAEQRALEKEEAEAAAPESGSPPTGGSSELEGGCTGSGACAASTIQCTVKHRFGQVENGLLEIGAETRCNQTMGAAEVEVCIYDQNGGNLAPFGEGPPCHHETTSKKNYAFIEVGVGDCHDGTNYVALVWGWAASGRYVYKSHWASEAVKCSDSSIDWLGLAEFGLEQISNIGNPD